MEQQDTQQKRAFEPIEKAKLAMRLVGNPDFEREIDDYVSGKNYDETSINLFKQQIGIQQRLQKEGGRLLSTGGQIVNMVVNALAKGLQDAAARSAGNGGSDGRQ